MSLYTTIHLHNGDRVPVVEELLATVGDKLASFLAVAARNESGVQVNRSHFAGAGEHQIAFCREETGLEHRTEISPGEQAVQPHSTEVQHMRSPSPDLVKELASAQKIIEHVRFSDWRCHGHGVHGPRFLGPEESRRGGRPDTRATR